MLYNKIRPQTFDGVTGQDVIVKSLQGQSIAGKFFHLYILEGQYGSGKTTTARILALSANCEHKDKNGNPCLECEHCKAILSENCNDYMEIDAASNTGVEKARLLIEDVSYMPTYLKKKIYIIDEAHMLSKAAFNCLLKTLEDSPEYAMFILCTTDKDAIPLTIQSRAATYTFRKISESVITNYILEAGKRQYPDIAIEEAAASAISAHSDGSMRNALSLLEQAVTYGNVTLEHVHQMIGAASTQELLELMRYLMLGDMPECILSVRRLINEGRDLVCLTTKMLQILQDTAILSVAEDMLLIPGTSEYRKDIQSLAALTDNDQICHMIKELMVLRSDLRKNPIETIFTCCLVKICSAEKNRSTKNLETRIRHLEDELNSIKRDSASPPPAMPSVMMDTIEDKTPSKQAKKVTAQNQEEIRETCKMSDQKIEKTDTGTEKKLYKDACHQTGAAQNDYHAKAQESEIFTSEELLMMFGIPSAASAFSMKEEPRTCAAKIHMDSNGSSNPIPEGDSIDNASSAALHTIALIDEIKEEYPAFCSAIEEGSKRLIFGDVVKYYSPLKPICNLLKSFFDTFQIPSEACFDPNIEV